MVNKRLIKKVKQEIDFINEVEEYQYEESEECQMISLIIFSIQLDNQARAQGLVDLDSISDFIFK